MISAAPRRSPPPRKRWPLSVLAVAIVAGIALFAFLRLHRAKPGKPPAPRAESRERAEAQRLAAAGWTHFAADFEPLADLPEPQGALRTLPQRPAEASALAALRPAAWLLPIEYARLAVSPALAAGRPYSVHLLARLDRPRAQIIGFDLYRKDADVLVVPRWEKIPDGLVPRDRPVTGRMVWPPGVLPAGSYRITLLAVKTSVQWDLTVAAE